MSTNAKFAAGMIFYLVFSLIGMGIYANHLEDQVTHYKELTQDEHTRTIETQLKYEEARDEKAQLEQDLADRDERLAEAAERDRAAKVRASRSRPSRSNADVQSSRSSGLGGSTRSVREDTFTGGRRNITMYCPTGNRTASGKWPQRGMVATMERSIPFGTHILIEGLGSFTVEDRIGSGSEFDIFTPSCAEADRFGRQHRRVTIRD